MGLDSQPVDIPRLRRDMGLSQIEFGQLLDVHFMTVSKWERGLLMPTPYQMELMREFRKAANTKNAQVKEQIKGLLVGAGVIAALFFLLKASRGQ